MFTITFVPFANVNSPALSLNKWLK
jgi:hypothetical protein